MQLAVAILCVGTAAFFLRVLAAFLKESRIKAPRPLEAYMARFRPSRELRRTRASVRMLDTASGDLGFRIRAEKGVKSNEVAPGLYVRERDVRVVCASSTEFGGPVRRTRRVAQAADHRDGRIGLVVGTQGRILVKHRAFSCGE